MTAKLNLKNNWTALIIFTIISLIVLFPIFTNISYLGTADWDQHFFYNAVPRKTILTYHQIPLWNPYYCGGNVLLAHPESAFLSPFFIFILLFGTVIGLKLQILFHMILGMFGMFLLSKQMKLKSISCYIPAFIFMLSSWFIMHILVGHTLYLTMAYLPFIFLFYLKSLNKLKYVILSALFLAIMFLGGGTYPFAFSILFLAVFSFFNSIKNKSIKSIKNILIIIIITLLLGAVKFMPSYFFIKENAYSINDKQPVSIKTFLDGLLSRDQGIRESRTFYSEFIYPHREYSQGELREIRLKIKTKWSWHEYSAYIGVISFILFILSLFLLIKKEWDLILAAFIFIILYFGHKAFLYSVLNMFPIFKSLHGSSRLTIIIIFCIALLAGKAFSFFEKKKFRYRNYVLIFIVLLVLIDLITVIFPYSNAMFFRKPDIIIPSENFYHAFLEDRYSDQYVNFLENKGSINCYERLHLPFAISPKYYLNNTPYEKYRGEIYLLKNKGITKLSYFSPNKIKVEVDLKQNDILVINQNYFKGWKAKGKEVISYNGLIATEATPYDKEVVFYYLPKGFIFGFIISIISLICCLLLFFKKIIY